MTSQHRREATVTAGQGKHMTARKPVRVPAISPASVADNGKIRMGGGFRLPADRARN
jgi:hypothetical protein